MKYHNITKDDMLNGDGLRVVLWLSGCSHRCENCQNPITWDENDGLDFDDNAKNEIFNLLRKDYISGITFSGGDPLFYKNRPEVLEFMKEIKKEFPDKTIWLYSGYTWEEVGYIEILDYVDVFVDGKFVEQLKDNKLKWRGSSNQHVIDVKQSRLMHELVLHCD